MHAKTDITTREEFSSSEFFQRGPMKAAEKISKAMKARGRFQKAVAEEIGVTDVRFSKWMNGEGRPTLHQYAAICRALMVSLEWLANGEDDDVPDPKSTEDMRVLRMIFEGSGRIGLEEAVRRIQAYDADVASGKLPAHEKTPPGGKVLGTEPPSGGTKKARKPPGRDS